MRILLMLVIFAIGFGGYVTAAHAFGKDICQSAAVGHQDETNSYTCHDSKDKCGDCAHCCVLQALNTASAPLKLPVLTIIDNHLSADIYTGDFLSSLFRPPKDFLAV